MPFSLITFFIAMVFIFLPQGPVSAALVALSSRKVRSMAFCGKYLYYPCAGGRAVAGADRAFVDVFGLKMAVLGCLSVLLPACLFLHLSAKLPVRKAV